MLVNKTKFKLGITELLMLIAAAVFTIGIRSWFSVCEVGEMVMSCHWAGEVLKALSLILLVLAVIHIVMPDLKMMIGMDVAYIFICLVAAFIPGSIISLCGNLEMQCQTAARPWSLILSIALGIFALLDIILCGSAISKEKHSRKADS